MEAITVSQLNGYIKNIFDAEELLHNISVIGGVFGVSVARQTVYFSLKDDNSMLPCVCFYPALFSEIKEGEQLIVTGSPNFYAKGGKLSFNVIKLEKVGQGKLYEEFLKLKQRLEAEGLFAPEHKKPIPTGIKRIGVITSKDGAVIQDIKNVAWRRNPSVDIVLYPVKVQGRNAEIEIANAIEHMSNYENIDVIIVARGGGSLEDLSAYNTEIVARATYNCEKPIVSAVGHETDFTIIDFVSDLRAPTPSAAAELLTFTLADKKEATENLVDRFILNCDNYLQTRFNRVYTNFVNCHLLLERKYTLASSDFNSKKIKLVSAMEKYLNERAYSLGLQENSLNKLNPIKILSQGYAKIEQGQSSVKDKKSLNLEEDINIIFIDGRIKAKPIKEEK